MEKLTNLCNDVAREHQLDTTRTDEVDIRDNNDLVSDTRDDLEGATRLGERIGFAPLAACVNSWAANKILQLRWDRAITYKRRVAQGGPLGVLAFPVVRQHHEIALPSTSNTDDGSRLLVLESEDEETAQLPSVLLSLS
ncbi:hypothetical protein BDB00DRAFT_872623 [Zychaea mexicana]|uniref:uncharacterized protein n=1 Tax=Zychaea mexicana TaxID=64656 RepID=UPI0022FED84B|nr:uncharacterized protein BDB00DRAFT_872623 [Zychaea mexicana]KAI9493105.1 hypothetical protein BDB00DRAFT_872623 [Zychaea mexicana]